MNLSILYNTNPVPLAICAPPSPEDLEQQRLGVEKKLQEEDKYVPARRKIRERKVAHRVIIRKVSMRTSSGNFVDPKDFSISCGWKEGNDKL